MADRRLSAVLGRFDREAALLDAARALAGQGYRLDAFTPYPVPDLYDIIGFHDRRVPLAALGGGAAGVAIGYGLQVLANRDYPLWIGGRSLYATPSFVLTTVVIGIFGAILCAVAMMLFANRLPRLHHPLFDAEGFDLGGGERFYLAVIAGAGFDRDAAGRALAALHPDAIIDVFDGGAA